MLKITITGAIPSKKNSVALFHMADGRIGKAPGANYRQWHKQASTQLYGVKSIANIASVIIKVYAPDRRRADLTNKAESVMDLLVDNKIIEDDNWHVCPNIYLKFCGVDKLNPRAEVEIN